VFELKYSSGSYTSSDTVLYGFGASSSDGASPVAGLLMDSSGNLYGTTFGGGAHNAGAVFELKYSNGSYASSDTVLYSFGASGSGDGANPVAGLLMDSSGNLYGTTSEGGVSGDGTVFELASSGGTYTESVLHNFSGSDGTIPSAGLISDSLGNLYGTAAGGGDLTLNCFSGICGGDGTVFALATTPQAAVQLIIGQVNALYSAGVLNSGQDNSLVKQLQDAIKMINAGKIRGAIGNLESFITEVDDLENSGVLNSGQASSLVTAAISVIEQL
jgi:uncharacterized repeat protein (TIGR03803 family)